MTGVAQTGAHEVPFPAALRELAALAEKGAWPVDGTGPRLRSLAVQHRLAPTLALRAMGEGDEGTAEALRQELFRVAARAALLAALRREISATLAQAEVPWAPIKGMDLAFRPEVYPRAEERPTADLDLLVAEGSYRDARAALEAAGWRPLHPDGLEEGFLAAEGYCWQAVRGEAETLLEVHFRLWGMLPTGAAEAALAAAAAHPELPAPAAELSLEHAWSLAAAHAFTDPSPRSLHHWRDLYRIAAAARARGRDAADGFVRGASLVAGRWGLQLPAGLAAAAASSLWACDESSRIAVALCAQLRPSERPVWRRARRRGLDAVGLPSITLARLLAGRPSRTGWRAVWRRVRPHPAVRARGREG